VDPPSAALDFTWTTTYPGATKDINPVNRENSTFTLTFNDVISIVPGTTSKIVIEECFWSTYGQNVGPDYDVTDGDCKHWCDIPASDEMEVRTEFKSLIVTPFINCRLARNGQYRVRIEGPKKKRRRQTQTRHSHRQRIRWASSRARTEFPVAGTSTTTF
jgi:hypothetical protein